RAGAPREGRGPAACDVRGRAGARGARPLAEGGRRRLPARAAGAPGTGAPAGRGPRQDRRPAGRGHDGGGAAAIRRRGGSRRGDAFAGGPVSAVAEGAGRAMRAAERRPWLVVAALVVIEALARLVVSRGNVAPWIFIAELLYGELGKNLADHLSLTIRDQHPYYSLLVPIIHAPGFLLGSAKAAYIWIKAVNALVMAL